MNNQSGSGYGLHFMVWLEGGGRSDHGACREGIEQGLYRQRSGRGRGLGRTATRCWAWLEFRRF